MRISDWSSDVCSSDVAGTAEEVVRMALQEAPELVLMDVRLSGEKDGVDADHEIYKTRVIPIVYVTASRERTTSVRIRQDLPAQVITQPVLARHPQAQPRRAAGRERVYKAR